MKRILSCLLLAFGFLAVACSHIDTTPAPMGYKTLTGTIHIKGMDPLAQDAVALVRIIDVTKPERYGMVVAETEIRSLNGFSIPFSLDYKAEDIDLPNRVQLEARVSIRGRLKYRNLNALPLTIETAAQPVNLWLELVSR